MEVFAELARDQTLGQSRRAHIFVARGDDEALPGWFNGFSRAKTGNYSGEFHLAKKASGLVITVRIILFQSNRTTRPGCPWTWSVQVVGGPEKLIQDRPTYSNLYFAGPEESAVSVLGDVRGGGYAPTQPPHSSAIDAIARKHDIADRVAAAEDRAFTRKPARTRVIDT